MRDQTLPSQSRVLDLCTAVHEIAMPDEYIPLLGHEPLCLETLVRGQLERTAQDMVVLGHVVVITFGYPVIQRFGKQVCPRDDLEFA